MGSANEHRVQMPVEPVLHSPYSFQAFPPTFHRLIARLEFLGDNANRGAFAKISFPKIPVSIDGGTQMGNGVHPCVVKF
jgi:hypothetical protein